MRTNTLSDATGCSLTALAVAPASGLAGGMEGGGAAGADVPGLGQGGVVGGGRLLAALASDATLLIWEEEEG